jgi:hypothetical protein
VASVVRIARGMTDLVRMPVTEYLSPDGNVLRGLQAGSSTMARTLATETASTAGALLRQTKKVLVSVKSLVRQDTALAASVHPQNASDGLRLAAGSLAHDLRATSAEFMSVLPLQRSGQVSEPGGYFARILMALPIVTLQPAIGITQSASTVLDGVSKTLSPHKS